MCGEPGDSGGSWYSGPDHAAQAQGVTSGGIVGCPGDGPMYFQPLTPILDQWNLDLTTG
ncbi:hypothetical protein RIF23_17500 [Lipingzhangella sp. LS1_29]|uniref:Uncharacterized protein n=1 Tax=Lipingzhangella rawalii TaxID=2055835 RepID=A0ABU2HA00_9ACTN|nr:hypothetical protein [Lipingzhangella rawalii]MDS1272088.1 hypothetical protein [Lipingzhangella rawalii]